MPSRFDVRYVDARGERRPLVMLHRALYGSLERFMGILLEHHGPSLPPWLAPVQAVVIPVSPAQHDAARALDRALRGDGLRAALDLREESLARRIAESHAGGVPFALVVGAREVERGSVAIRGRDGQRERGLDEARAELRAACAGEA